MNQIKFDLGGYPAESGFTMAVGEQPEHRLEFFGVRAASDTELMAMILHGNGLRTEQVVSLASRLVAEAGSIAGLIGWTADDYRRMRGIGRIKGLQLTAMGEIARRMMTPRRTGAPLLDRAEAIAAHLAPTVAGLQIEKFFLLCLNRKNRLIKQVEITSGTATAALVHPRELLRAALQIHGGVTIAICVAHNHPSGSCEPSAADIALTRQLRDASSAVDIPLLDHLILGLGAANPNGKNFYSFREAGML